MVGKWLANVWAMFVQCSNMLWGLMARNTPHNAASNVRYQVPCHIWISVAFAVPFPLRRSKLCKGTSHWLWLSNSSIRCALTKYVLNPRIVMHCDCYSSTRVTNPNTWERSIGIRPPIADAATEKISRARYMGVADNTRRKGGRLFTRAWSW